jgi:hypothetical protein
MNKKSLPTVVVAVVFADTGCTPQRASSACPNWMRRTDWLPEQTTTEPADPIPLHRLTAVVTDTYMTYFSSCIWMRWTGW